MTTTHHATVRATPRWDLFHALRRWASTDANDTPEGRRARRSRRRTPFTPLSAPSLAVWEVDQSDLDAALDHGRW